MTCQGGAMSQRCGVAVDPKKNTTHHFPPPLISDTAGGGRIGGRVSPYFRFCTSISEKSIAGAAAETGTLPDSAPQIPLNTLVVSPVAAIWVKTVRGVPTISTPRTS